MGGRRWRATDLAIPAALAQELVTALMQASAAAMWALLAKRGPGKTICPSDVARGIGGEAWRERMDLVRAVADDLAAGGQIVISQRGRVPRLHRRRYGGGPHQEPGRSHRPVSGLRGRGARMTPGRLGKDRT